MVGKALVHHRVKRPNVTEVYWQHCLFITDLCLKLLVVDPGILTSEVVQEVLGDLFEVDVGALNKAVGVEILVGIEHSVGVHGGKNCL